MWGMEAAGAERTPAPETSVKSSTSLHQREHNLGGNSGSIAFYIIHDIYRVRLTGNEPEDMKK
jgi:hypothetical protein